MTTHAKIKEVLNSELSQAEKIAKLKRMAYDAAEMEIADSENMHAENNGMPGVDQIVDVLNELSGEHYKVKDFYPPV